MGAPFTLAGVLFGCREGCNSCSMLRMKIAFSPGAFTFVVVTSLALVTPSRTLASDERRDELMQKEETLYLQARAALLHPDYWISYKGVLYMEPKTAKHIKFAMELRESFKGYSVLTNAYEKYKILTNAMTRGGILKSEQEAVLLHPDEIAGELSVPRLGDVTIYSATEFKLTQSLENGDALIDVGGETLYVYGFGRAADGGLYGETQFADEGLKAYTSVLGARKTVKAVSILHFTTSEKDLLERVSKSLLR